MSWQLTLLKWLKVPYLPWLAAGLGLLLTLPAIGSSLELDDYFHRAIYQRYKRSGFGDRKPEEMFRFLKGDPQENLRLMDAGFLPWWTDPQIKAEFLQYITAKTHAFDYLMWPDSPQLMHAHSLAWLAAVVLLTSLWYRRLYAGGIAGGLAALLFAMEDAHAGPVGWLCNRNVLVACTFGMAALLCHHAWRGKPLPTVRERKRKNPTLTQATPPAAATLSETTASSAATSTVTQSGGGIADNGAGEGRGVKFLWAIPALGFFALALFSKEEGLATAAYLGAYAFWFDKAPLPRRLATLLPYAVVVLIWRYLRSEWGYGVAHMGLYVDPVDTPALFARSVAERLPILVLAQLGLPPADLYSAFTSSLGVYLWTAACLFCGLLLILLWPLLKKSPTMRFSLCGMLLAMIPVCATTPGDRLLTFPSIGAMAVVAEVLQVWLLGPGLSGISSRAYQPLRWLAFFWISVHVLLAPLSLVKRSGHAFGSEQPLKSFYVQLPNDLNLQGKTVNLLAVPSAMHCAYLPVLREFERLTVPDQVRALAPLNTPLLVRRANEWTLIVRAEGGYQRFLIDSLFRNQQNPFRNGQEVRLRGLTITVLEITEDGRARTVQFAFDEPLGSPRYVWYYWRQGKWIPFPLPAVGEELLIQPPRLWDIALSQFAAMPGGVDPAPAVSSDK